MKIADTFVKKEQQIAYIYMCHNDPNLLDRVAKTLNYKNDAIFVHVDEKVEITPFVQVCSKHENVYFVKNRIKNYWGGFNAVSATIETMKLALASGAYTRFVLLQGQDYPLVSPKVIHEFFKSNPTIEYCRAKDITISPQKRDYIKWSGYWIMDVPDCFFAKVIRSAIARLNCIGIKYRSGIFKYKKENWHIYHGWAQIALTRECVEYIINMYENCQEYNNFMKHRFPPDEIYFHTLIWNSKFKNRVAQNEIMTRTGEMTLLNCTYFEYPKKVTLFKNKEDYGWLKDTGCLFVRKVNSNISKELLEEIDKSIDEVDT